MPDDIEIVAWWGVHFTFLFPTRPRTHKAFLVVWWPLPYMAVTHTRLPLYNGLFSLQQEGLLFSWYHNKQVAQLPRC